MTRNGKVAIAEDDFVPQTAAKDDSWMTRLKSVPTPVWEALILTPVILVVIGLFLLPTVYYALPPPQVRR
jgi:hypothetical protein